MDKHEEPFEFKEHKPIDHVGIAKNLISSYKERLSQYIEKSKNELEESDFVKEQIAKHTHLLSEKNQFTYGVKWQIFMKHTKKYLDFLREKQEFLSDKFTTSEKLEKCTAYLKIYCLKKFAPELFDRLQKKGKKEDKEIIIRSLTGVNKRDSYTYFNISVKDEAWVVSYIDGEFIKRLEELKSKLI